MKLSNFGKTVQVTAVMKKVSKNSSLDHFNQQKKVRKNHSQDSKKKINSKSSEPSSKADLTVLRTRGSNRENSFLESQNNRKSETRREKEDGSNPIICTPSTIACLISENRNQINCLNS